VGYDLHITRRKNWSDRGAEISAQEWLALVRQDPELRLKPENGPYFALWNGPSELEEPWLDWSDGQICSKYPDAALIEKMVHIARQLGATVQGDDGEIYEGGSQPPRQPPVQLRERISGWFHRLRPARPLKIEIPELPFKVGDRVRDPWGSEHTIMEIDPQAENGIGAIRTRRDDGRELKFVINARFFTPINQGDDRGAA